MNSYILDTNIFFNMEAGTGLGQTTMEIVLNLKKIKENNKEIILNAPPSVAEEIKTFFNNENDAVLINILDLLTIKSPNISEIKVSATIFENLISDYRERSYRSMKVSEEEIIETGRIFMGKETLPHKEFQIAVGKKISILRDRFRNATRTGTIDSKADLDLILLAKELEKPLVTTDEGVVKWSRMMGVYEVTPSLFGRKMQEFL